MDIYNIIGIIIALFSLFYAINTLNFSKRSFLLKDTYDPILNNLKKNKKILLPNNNHFDTEFLTNLKSSYLYVAFNRKEKKLIDSIIEISLSINEFKNNSNKYAEKSLINSINSKQKNKELNHIILEIENENGNNDLFSLVSSRDFSYKIYSGEFNLICVIGEKVKTFKGEEIGWIDDDIRKYTQDLQGYIEGNFLIDLPDIEENYPMTKFEWFLEGIETEVHNTFLKLSNYNAYENKYNELINSIDLLSMSINEKIKELLIPHYHFKKIWGKRKL